MLVKKKVKAVVICTNQEVAPPQVWAVVLDGLDKPNELVFVGGELKVASSEQTTKVGKGSGALLKNSTKPRPGCVAVDNEDLVKVRHLKHKVCREGALEHRECRCRLIVLQEHVLPQETCKWSCGKAKVLDELPVVPREAEKTAEATRQTAALATHEPWRPCWCPWPRHRMR